ncbi:DUF1361 domain-containing protein [Flavobacterium filum]|uniref:DUF1361 domain-containing protein n=1 Tax=Flavobacterium filum TaxID=370974 RepID=UPI0023F4632F|nr:DUF1361 domain-containing protein [Flavobacterium filum]
MKTIHFYLQIKKREFLVLSILTLFCLCLLLIRAKASNSVFFFFLIWNLFLGFLPYCISQMFFYSIKIRNNKWYRAFGLLVWLLFLPNSFYLLTDFFHLNKFNSVPVWFDLMVVSSFSLTGFLFGIFSLFTIEKLLRNHYSVNVSKIFLLISLYLTAFGIYLGRYLRFNSWDVLSNPINLLNSCINCLFISDVQNFTLGFGTFLMVIYFVATSMKKNETNNLKIK